MARKKTKDDLLEEMEYLASALDENQREAKGLYEKRDSLFFTCQKTGASLVEMAVASDVSIYAVKLAMGKRRKQ